MLIAVLSVLFGSVILDQLTKAIVVSQMALYEEVPFLPGLIRFYHTRNTGAAFSMFSDNRWVFMVFSVIAMMIMTYLLVKFHGRHWLLSVSLAAVLGGGIGNMIDRVLSGYVVDFLDFQFMKFAVFNVADIFVTCGSVALAVYILFIEPKVEKRLQEQKEAASAAEEGTHEGNDDGDQ
ncbi:MAG: signal peptidase II [Clostridia bacterium]|jgi:signal peptidase II|nr:signal peptidase II [Clostridia bacterium]MBQ2254422.1 signal peptidase II [Clostridia bacterium]